MAARKSAKNKSASSADPVIIDGQAEDVKVQESGKDAPNAETKKPASEKSTPDFKNTASQTASRKSSATVIAGLALFVALLASGGVGWMIMMMTTPQDTAWQDSITARLEAVEAKLQEQAGQQSAWQTHLDQQGEISAANETSIAALKEAQQALLDDLTALKLEIAARQSAINATADADTDQSIKPPAIDPAVIDALESDLAQLKSRLEALEGSVDQLTEAARATPETPATQPQSNAPATDADNADQGGWLSSLFGIVKISRIPAEDGAQ
ncbi:MAG: hypothetical protein EBU10_04960 [Alphaproteobacteria bacterium]|nr:hypothetical protein [Alphaproteobacteria bacterium]